MSAFQITARISGLAAGLIRAVSIRVGRFAWWATVGMTTQIRFSTDGLAPRDRVRSWCDYFAKQAHSITPSEIPDPDAFRGEASGSVAGEFALLDIKSGLERVQRTAADVARDKTEAFFIRRFRRPAIWRVTSGSMPVDLIHEPGDFCVSSTEWRFDAESKGPASFDMLVIPRAELSPLLAGGRLACPFRLPRVLPLGSLLGTAMDAANRRSPGRCSTSGCSRPIRVSGRYSRTTCAFRASS
jgi:hypothetical protein